MPLTFKVSLVWLLREESSHGPHHLQSQGLTGHLCQLPQQHQGINHVGGIGILVQSPLFEEWQAW